MRGRYRPKEAAEAWRMIRSFAREVFAADWRAERVRAEFSSETSPDYDFSRNVRLE